MSSASSIFSLAIWIGDGGRSDGGQTPPASGTKRAFGVCVQLESLLKPTRRSGKPSKWQWSDEFLAKARPDKGNYGQGDLFDDGLTKLERAQIEQGREAYLTGGAKLRYKRLTGQI